MKTGMYFILRVTLVGALALGTVMLGGVAPGAAQPLPPAPLARGLDRTAPVRAPVVLNREVGAASEAGVQIVATTVQLPAVADSYIASERPNENFGGDALFLGYNFFGDRFGAERIVIRFNVDTIPGDARVNSARLRLHLSFASPEDDAPMRTIVRRLASAWDEFGVTWNTEPAWASVRDSTSVGTDATWYEWEIGDLVQGWIDGDFPNHGVEIIGDERIQQRERVFYARETTTAFFPQLIVDYDVVDDVSPPDVEVEPLRDYSGRNFAVSWSGSDVGGAGIAVYDVQYRADGGDWVNWQEDVTSTTAEFTDGINGRLYEFRARGIDEVGNVEPFGAPEAATVVDSRPPTTTVDPLPALVTVNAFTVSWQGDDGGGSGIQSFDVRYRRGDEPWQLWQRNTIATRARFDADEDGVYRFEARAVDNIGRIEPFTGVAQATTVVDVEAPFLVPRLYLPIAFVQP